MSTPDKHVNYSEAFDKLFALLKDEDDRILKMATINCVLRDHFDYYFWVGFYLVKNDELLVGPYQGTLGCLHIPFGKGVCGVAAQKRETQVVPDVHEFPGHIACDSRSNSEIVVPVFDADGQLIAVFDVDSTSKRSFDAVDKQWLEKIVYEFFSK